MNNNIKENKYHVWIDLYWKHFELHSKQRMQMLQFYISIIVILFGGLFTLYSLEQRVILFEIVVCSMISLISLVFSFLDYRTSILIKDAEDSLKKIECLLISENENNIALFLQSSKNDETRNYISYSKSIRYSEYIISAIGVLLAICIYFNFF